jgi:hypothetical protein
MQTDFSLARWHVARARKLLGMADGNSRRLCEVLDLTIEAIAEMEFRQQGRPTNVIEFPLRAVRR